jgi:hypothetical protein
MLGASRAASLLGTQQNDNYLYSVDRPILDCHNYWEHCRRRPPLQPRTCWNVTFGVRGCLDHARAVW